jgi:hypothetical protein
LSNSSRSDSDYIFDADDHSDDADGGLDDALPRQHRQYEVVGEYDTYEAALRALETRNGNIYTYETRYETNRRHARVYRCRSHVACDHRLKIISLAIPTADLIYQLTEGGVHSRAVTNISRRGIDPRLRDEVDALLCMGWGPMRLRSLLLQRYSRDPAMLAVIPSARQLENRKAYLMRNSTGVGTSSTTRRSRLGQARDW